MNLKELFKKNENKKYLSVVNSAENYKSEESLTGKLNIPNVPDGLYTKCSSCHEMILTEDLYMNYMVCPKCGKYHKLDAKSRIDMVIDEGTFVEWDTDMSIENPCDYEGYEEKIKGLKKSTGLDEAVVTGIGKINGLKTVIGVCDTRFLMGSMGRVVGEKITRAVEKATELSIPIILFTCSGGARMQEGIFSLMQMAKTSAAIKKHDEKGNLYITVLTDPTTGGVTASFAMLGDIILAEPGALIGFAGPRVIKQTIGQDLPKGFQRSEFLLEHGFIDSIVKRDEMKETLGKLLKMHSREDQTARENNIKRYRAYLDELNSKKPEKYSFSQADTDYCKAHNDKKKYEKSYSAWDRVQLARSKKRPTARDFIERLSKNFIELHGDRLYGDDNSIVGGIAMFGKTPVTIIGQQKGRNIKENVKCNFGMPNPEGYRKALRLMKQADKFNRPVICFVDTPGAYPGLEAEERGQGEAIARNLHEMSTFKVPILSIIIGEGGSGGALALAVANEVWMFENAVYSILSPEGFASILWKDSGKAEQAAEVMKMTAAELKNLGIIEQVIPENPVLDNENINKTVFYMKQQIADFLIKYMQYDKEEIVTQRYDRYRGM